MELSRRLKAVASLVDEGAVIADIGTDHAYIPIDLVRRHVVPRAIAMDVHAGPLERAREHVCDAGFEREIELRLSDGFEKLLPGEADCAILAGMGGGLVTRILKEHWDVTQSLGTCILQPQSEIAKVRAFLLREGFLVMEEQMVCEDGKYYPMMKVIPPDEKNVPDEKGAADEKNVPDGQETAVKREAWDEVQLRFGKLLLQERHPVLKEFLERELRLTRQIIEGMPAGGGERMERRRAELSLEEGYIREGLRHYEI